MDTWFRDTFSEDDMTFGHEGGYAFNEDQRGGHHPSPAKKPLTGLFRDNPETPEGKYLVKRRDGTVVEWPNFVLGARDPIAEVALRAYAAEVYRIVTTEPGRAKRLGLTVEFANRLNVLAAQWADYRNIHGDGDPGMGRHRKDDPATIAEMRKGASA
jgi:hypothetical protein